MLLHALRGLGHRALKEFPDITKDLMKSDDHVRVLSLEEEAVGGGRMPRLGGCWGPREIKASQRVYAVLLQRIKGEMTAP